MNYVQHPWLNIQAGKQYLVKVQKHVSSKMNEKYNVMKHTYELLVPIIVDGKEDGNEIMMYSATDKAHAKLSQVVGKRVKMWKDQGDKKPLEVMTESGDIIFAESSVPKPASPDNNSPVPEQGGNTKDMERIFSAPPKQDDYQKGVINGLICHLASRFLAAKTAAGNSIAPDDVDKAVALAITIREKVEAKNI